jgi:hypothetical protein
MNVTSNIIGELGAATKVGSPTPAETSIQIPGVIQGTLELRANLRTLGPAGALVNNVSCLVSISNVITNGATVTATILTLAAGVWQLDLFTHYSSNYLTVPTTGFDVTLTLGSSVQLLMQHQTSPALGGTVTGTRTLKITSDTNFSIAATLWTNAAAQTHSGMVSILASRLL